MSQPDVYFIRFARIETLASIGLHDFEKAARQRLYVSLTLILERPHRLEDAPETVLDYDFAREGILKLVGARHYQLQEALCEDILDLCMAHPLVLGAVVQTDKPDVYADVERVSCRLARLSRGLAGFSWWTIDV
jgi:dihydroneopterin aldolase